jgi:hypothetical protein
MRYRRKLVESQAAERNRLLKVLENQRHKKWPSWPKGFYARRFPNWSWLWKASWKNIIVSCYYQKLVENC